MLERIEKGMQKGKKLEMIMEFQKKILINIYREEGCFAVFFILKTKDKTKDIYLKIEKNINKIKFCEK